MATSYTRSDSARSMVADSDHVLLSGRDASLSLSSFREGRRLSRKGVLSSIFRAEHVSVTKLTADQVALAIKLYTEEHGIEAAYALTNEEMARAALDPSNPLWALLVSPLRSMQRKGAVYLYAGPDALKMMHRWAAGAKGLERCTMMTPRARRLAASVLLALKPIHEMGCIVRDLKPENIFWFEGSEPESDFCQLGDFGGFVIRGGVWEPSFTLTYVSPEEAKEFEKLMSRQPINLTGASDFWKLGLTLVMLLVGRLPEALTVMEDSSSSDGGSYDRYSFCESYCMNVVALAAERDYWDVWLAAQGITDPLLLDFLVRLLKGKPEERIRMEDALNHPWVKGEVARVQQLVEAYTPTWQQRRADAEQFLEEDEVVEQQQRKMEEPAVVGQDSVKVADASTSTSSSGSSSTASCCRLAQTAGTITEVEAAADVTSSMNSSEAASSQRTAADASTMTECEAAAQPPATSSSRPPMTEAVTMTEEERVKAAPANINSGLNTGTGAANTSKQGSTECTNVAAAAVPLGSTTGSNTSTGGSRPSAARVNPESTSQEDNSTDSSAMAATAFQETSVISPRSSSSQDSEAMDALSTSLTGISIKNTGSTAAMAAGDVEEPSTPPTAMSRAASAPPSAWSPGQRSSRSTRYSSSADDFSSNNFNKASVRRSSSDTGGGSNGINNSEVVAAQTTLAVPIDNNSAGVAATEPSSAVGSGASISSGSGIGSSSDDTSNSSVPVVTASGAAVPASSRYGSCVPCGLPDSSNGTKFRYVRNKVTGHTKFQKVAVPCTCSAAVAVAGSGPKVQRRNRGDAKQVVVKEPAASSNKGGLLRRLGSLFCVR